MKHPFGQFNNDRLSYTFSEEMAERFDFTRCQRPRWNVLRHWRPTCRKGAQVGPKEIAALKKAAKGGNDRAQQALDKIEGKDSKPAVKEEAPKKAAVPAAESMSLDELNAVPEGSRVNLSDGSEYQMKDGKFYRVKEDGSLAGLDYKPGELSSEAKYRAKTQPRA